MYLYLFLRDKSTIIYLVFRDNYAEELTPTPQENENIKK